MAGNGDERMMRAWEGVGAKLLNSRERHAPTVRANALGRAR